MAIFYITNQPEPIDFSCNSDILLRTIQNAKNLLMCRMGEVPYDRYRGLNPAIFEMTIDEMQEEIIPELDRVMIVEPDVEVADAEVSMMEDGTVLIEVALEIKVGEFAEE